MRKISLSSKKAESFVGDVIPLWLVSDENVESADIKWECDGDAVSFRSFENEAEQPFKHGILLRLLREGEAKITATLDGVGYSCNVLVRRRKEASPSDKFNYYRGDLHTHTTRIHNHEEFVNRTEGFQSDMVGFIKNEGLLDFGVLSDHSEVMGAYGFFHGFKAAYEAMPMSTVLFPGSESENVYSLPDRLGKKIRRAGEMVVINADYHRCTDSWETFLDSFKDSPAPIGIFAHPALDGWDYDFERNSRRKELKKLMRFVEVGNGADVKNNLLHEYAFSRALDAGFRVSTSIGSDGHGIWGYKICPGKTIIMATEKTKEAFTDALLNLRAYASESANVKVALTVNSKPAPADIENTDTYSFNLSISYFEDDESTKIVKCQVISDGGLTVFEKSGITEDAIDFEIKSTTARYFYLRLVDKDGRRTFSPPVFLGREYDEYKEPRLSPISAENFSAKDEFTGTDATALVRFDGHSAWTNGKASAKIVIDMKAEETLSALGIYYSDVPKREKLNPSSNCTHHAGYPRRYEISVSLDGKEYAPLKSGMLRGSCGEETVELEKTSARFVRFEILSTVGQQYEREKYKTAPIKIGGLTLFKPQ